MSTANIERMTRHQAEARRRKIIKLVGGDEVAFVERAHEYLLDAAELALFDELKGLEFLLGLDD